MSLLKSLGKNPSGKRLERIKQSPNYKNNAFQNLSPTNQLSKDTSYAKIMKDSMTRSKHVEPTKVIPFVKTDLHTINAEEPVIVWFGHSSYLLKIYGKTILVDPVFSGNASPFSFMIKAFKGTDEYKAEHMPKIDLLLLTHDHYDHLDYKTLKLLRSKIKQIYCPLGVGSHLEHWGFEESRITELDWWEKSSFADDIEITAAPARHYTGRTMTRSKMLWASYVLKTKAHSVYLGGDSGYDTHFKMIGELYGPFDIALLESGQYNTSWPNIHMMPEETVQASIDLKSGVLFPIHWGKFALAMHDWDEPIKRIVKKAEELNVKVTTPMIGEPLLISKYQETKFWWEFE